jgi:hypothetical protein
LADECKKDLSDTDDEHKQQLILRAIKFAREKLIILSQLKKNNIL